MGEVEREQGFYLHLYIYFCYIFTCIFHDKVLNYYGLHGLLGILKLCIENTIVYYRKYIDLINI